MGVPDENTEEKRLMYWLNGILISVPPIDTVKKLHIFSKIATCEKPERYLRDSTICLARLYKRMLFGKRIVFTVVNVYITSEILHDKLGITPATVCLIDFAFIYLT